MASKRINLNMDEELLNRLDEYAEKIHINRTSAVCVIISMFLDGLQANQNNNDMLQVLKKLTEKED